MSSPRFAVCALGNAIVDVLASAPDDFLVQEGIAKGAMTLIDESRAEELYGRMGAAVEVSGGSAANTVAGVASFGGKAAFMGKVKDDQLGKVFRHDMTAIGVHYTTPPVTEGLATARCLILVTPDAQRSMNTFLGASVDFGPADIQPELIETAQVTYLEGYLFDKPAAQQAFREAAAIARKAGRKLALTLSDVFCVERHRAAFRMLIADSVDILFANHNEILALYETDTLEDAIRQVRTQCALAVVTLSEQGAIILAGDQDIRIAAEPVAHIVDTTGAGDLFAAGFLYGLSEHRPMAECGRLGAMAAAEVISHFGPRPQKTLRNLLTAQSCA